MSKAKINADTIDDLTVIVDTMDLTTKVAFGDTSETFSLENHPPSRFDESSSFDTDSNKINNKTSKTAIIMAMPVESSSSSSVLRLVSTGTELVDFENQRIADLCCGVCCDLVKACIIVNCFDIILSTLLLGLSALGYSEMIFFDTINFSVFEPMNDDEFRESVQEDRAIYTLVTITTICGIIFSIVGILGALHFHKYMVLATAIWYCFEVIRCAVGLQWINICVMGLYAYPHLALFLALKSKKITRERYPVEKHCCCV